MNWTKPVALSALFLVLVPGLQAHRISVIARAVTTNAAMNTGAGTFGGSPTWGNDGAKGIKWEVQRTWEYGFPGPLNLTATSQQSGTVYFTLEWLPDGPSDVPTTDGYTVSSDIYLTIGAGSKAQNYDAKLTTTIQSLLVSRQKSAYYYNIPAWQYDGVSFENFPTDQGFLAMSGSPAEVHFSLQNGRYVGTIAYPVSIAAMYNAYGISSSLKFWYGWTGVRQRIIPMTCAGVTIG